MSNNDPTLTDNKEEETEDGLGINVEQSSEQLCADETPKPAHTSDDPYKTRS